MSNRQTPLCFLYLGTEWGKKQEAIAALKKKAAEKAGAPPEEQRYYIGETELSLIVSDVQNASLFSPSRIFLIINAEQIKKKDEIDLIAKTISALPSGTYLVFISEANSVGKRLENLIPKDHKKIFWELFDSDKQRWVRDYLKKFELNISDKGIQSILELVENNTHALRQELDKFEYIFKRGTLIDDDMVEDLLSRTRQESAFTLFSAIAQQDREQAMDIVQSLLASKEASIAIIAGLSWCFKRLADYLSLKERASLSDFELKKVGITSKKARADYSAASNFYTTALCMASLRALAHEDLTLRSFSGPLERIRMELLILRLLDPADF